MNEDKTKILTADKKVVTFEEFFAGDRETHKQQAKLPFEEKIRILITLQNLAVNWGGKKDVIVWKM